MFNRLATHRPPTIRNLSTRTRRVAISTVAVIPAVLIGVLGSTSSGAPQDSGLERQLRRDAGVNLFFRRHLSRFVVEDGVVPGRKFLDAVGACAQGKDALAHRKLDAPANLRIDTGYPAPAFDFPASEPLRDAHEARPPECARFRVVFERGEMPGSDLDQRTRWVRW